jgi:hypothetical protein
MDFLSPWSLAGLVLVPALFLWGVLAPRGRRTVVGSLLLWRRALGSGLGGRPSVRARLRDPLLWLDAAAVLVLVLACARPAYQTEIPDQPVATLVIDRTASLRIKEGGRTRADAARTLAPPVLQAAEGAPIRLVCVPGVSGMVEAETITAAEVLAAGSPHWRPLPAARDVWPEVIAQAAADRDRPVLVVTDIAPSDPTPANVFVLAPGGQSANAGLTRAASRIEGGKAWLLVGVRTTPTAPGPVWGYRVTGQGNFHEAFPFGWQGGGAGEAVIPLNAPLPPTLRVEMISPDMIPVPPDDVFPYDNQVRMVLRPALGLGVVVSGRPAPSLQDALGVIPGVRLVEVAAGAPVRAGEADLVVAGPAGLPPEWAGPAAIVMPAQAVGPIRPLDGEAEGEAEGEAAWEVRAAHPLTDALYAGTPRIGKVRRYALGPGARLLLGTPEVPLMATWEDAGARRLAILFPLEELATDWPNREGFPVFWSYALQWLVPADRRPAEYAIQDLPSAVKEWGPSVPVEPSPEGFLGSDEPYQSGPGRDDSAAAIEAISASVAARRQAAHADLWPWLAAAALLLLAARAWVAR